MQYLTIFDGAIMINKQVKEYSGRQRIDLNKSDGFTPGAEVVVLLKEDYDNIKTKLYEFNAMDKELQILKNQEQNLKQIIEDVTAPIDNHYQNELEKKDKQIERLEDELNTLKAKANQYNLDMQGLNLFDIGLFRKHKKLIQNFNDDLVAISNDQKIIDADAKAIPGSDP